jgi:ubiquinone biosynthesis protein
MSCERFKENLSKRDVTEIFYIPKIYDELTKENILVMEKINGTPFSDKEGIAPIVDQIHIKLETGLQYFMMSFLQDGFFHADLHGGNFFYMDNGKIGIIDYGLMGSLGKKSRINFIAIVYALITFNYENLVYEFLDVAEYEKSPDVDNLINDVKDALNPFIGLTVKQTNYSEVFRVVTSCLLRHELFLPRDWFIVFRALMTLDGVGKSLNMDIDIFGLLESDMTDVLKSTVDKNEVIEELVWATRDILPILRIFPRHLKWFLKDFAKKNYEIKIRHTGYEGEIRKAVGSIKFLGFSLFSSSLIVSGVLLNNGNDVRNYTDIPIISYIFWLLGLISFVRGYASFKK